MQEKTIEIKTKQMATFFSSLIIGPKMFMVSGHHFTLVCDISNNIISSDLINFYLKCKKPKAIKTKILCVYIQYIELD